MTLEDKIDLLNRLPHKLQVAFALYCAKDIMHLINAEHKDLINKIIKTIELWLIDKATHEEAKDAAYQAKVVFTNLATSAAYFAVYTAAAAYDAAYAVSYASNAYDAAYAAAFVASTAIYASKASGKNIEFYYDHLLEMIKSMPELEKVIYGVDLD